MRQSLVRLAFESPDDLGRPDPLDFTTSMMESVVTRFALGTSIPTKLQAPLRMIPSGGNTHGVLLQLRERNYRDTRQQLCAGQRRDALEDPALCACAGVRRFHCCRVGPKIIIDERTGSRLQDQVTDRSGLTAHDQGLKLKQLGIQTVPAGQLEILDDLELVTLSLLPPTLVKIPEPRSQIARDAWARRGDRRRGNEGQGSS